MMESDEDSGEEVRNPMRPGFDDELNAWYGGDSDSEDGSDDGQGGSANKGVAGYLDEGTDKFQLFQGLIVIG